MPDNIYAPYEVKAEIKNQLLQLQLSKKLRTSNFILFRIYPFILLALLALAFTLAHGTKSYIYLAILGLAVIILMFMLILKKYPVFISIEKDIISITEKQFGKTVLHSVKVKDIEKITCYESGGRGGGTYFNILQINGKKISLFNIPIIKMSREKTETFSIAIKNITNIETSFV